MEPKRLSPGTRIPELGGATVGDFWAWAYSDILINTTRGVFAEFLVGTALGVVGGVRSAWDSFDLLYEGAGIEVKSSAYVQGWPQEKPSSISWGIEERFPFDEAANSWGEERGRSADCYVFCLYAETEREGADVLDVGKWRFYVVSTERIDRELGAQKRVGLGKIGAMTEPVGFAGLKERVGYRGCPRRPASRRACIEPLSRACREAIYMTEVVGRRFAYRERAHTAGDPVRPVELVKEGPPRSQKAKVRWLDGEYEGLEEWVPKVRLVAPWEEAEALLEDERRMFAALEASGDVYGTATYLAAEAVFFAVPQEAGAEVLFGIKAIERELLSIDDLDAAAFRLGLDAEHLLAEPLSYVDRFGEYKAPFGTAVKVAKRCCENFTQEILRYLRAEEEELRRGLVSGEPDPSREWWYRSAEYRERVEARLTELRPVFALVREWCGREACEEFREVMALREEVDRLRGIVKDTARWLKDSGHPLRAALVLKELDRPEGAE